VQVFSGSLKVLLNQQRVRKNTEHF